MVQVRKLSRFLSELLLLVIIVVLLVGCTEGKTSSLGVSSSETSKESSRRFSMESATESSPSSLSKYTSSFGLSSASSSDLSSATSTGPSAASSSSLSNKLIKQVPVLYYHSILQEPGNELRIPPPEFEEQMKYLYEQGYKSITLNQLFDYLYADGKLPEKPIVITFDDGYKDNYTNAYPILRKYGFTATVFMVANYIDGKGFLSGAEVRELVEKGWQIEGHTLNHVDLSRTDPIVRIKELVDSKIILEKITGNPVRFLAYPYGSHNPDVVKAAKEAGYIMAFTTERGWAGPQTDPMLVKRVYVFANMGMKEFIHRLQNPNY